MAGEQHERGDDFQAVHGQRERVRMPPGLAVLLGELPHMAIADRFGQPGQDGDRGGGRPADSYVSLAGLPHFG